MKLVTIDCIADGVPGAILRSGEILHLRKAAAEGTTEVWIPNSLRGILESGPDGLNVVRRLVERVEGADPDEREGLRALGAISDASTRLLAPIPTPRLIVAAGLAYRSHLAEMAGTPVPKNPTAFMKASGSVTGPYAQVALPLDASAAVDYEGELAMIFGSTCHRVSRGAAMQCVAGFTVANDISARDWVRAVWEAEKPWEARTTWEVNIMGKQFQGFTPMGPALVTTDEIPDVSALRLTTRLNGDVMQSSPVADLIFELSETIAYFSQWYAFRPGDVLLTGTPAGVGVGRSPPVFMRSGDVVEVEISALGVLRNTIQAMNEPDATGRAKALLAA